MVDRVDKQSAAALDAGAGPEVLGLFGRRIPTSQPASISAGDPD